MLRVFYANIRLSLNNLLVPLTHSSLFSQPSLMKKKSFMTFTFGVCLIKLFTFVSDTATK
jgi:hypothetical protein